MADELPRYLERGGEIVAPQPYAANDALIYAFILRADEAKLGAMFDRFLTRPSEGAVDVRPAGGSVILTVSRIASLRPVDPPYSELGQAAELEFALWVPGIDVRRQQLVWFHPYLFVDQHLALAAGREVYGFPKQLGAITIGEPDKAPAGMTLDVFALARFGPDSRAGSQRLIEVRRGDAPAPAAERGEEWKTPAHLWRAAGAGRPDLGRSPDDVLGLIAAGLEGLVDAARLLAHIADDFLHGRMRLIFLKQFRDAAQPDRACHQAIVEASTTLKRFRGAGALGPYTVTIADVDGEPLRGDLGLPAGPIQPIASGWIHDDFVAERGVELWNARRIQTGVAGR
jgi:hypothetical protein